MFKKPVSKQIMPKNARRVFKGKIFEVYQWKQKMYDGNYATFERIKRQDTVVIFPVTDEGKIIITEQEQPGRKPFISMASGRVDEGEKILDAAKRELLEETGYKASKLVPFFSYQPTSKIEWAVYGFVAKGCKKVSKQNLDSGEKIKLKLITFDEFISLVLKRKLPDRELLIKILEAKLDKKKMKELKMLFLKGTN